MLVYHTCLFLEPVTSSYLTLETSGPGIPSSHPVGRDEYTRSVFSTLSIITQVYTHVHACNGGCYLYGAGAPPWSPDQP